MVKLDREKHFSQWPYLGISQELLDWISDRPHKFVFQKQQAFADHISFENVEDEILFKLIWC